MTQYCRYCANFVCGNGEWCEVKQWEPSERYAKSPNRCKEFVLNPIDAYGENLKGYQPRKPKSGLVGNQIRMEELLNENQAG